VLLRYLSAFAKNLITRLWGRVPEPAHSTADLSADDFLNDQLLRRIPSLTNDDFYAVNTETGERNLTSACFKIRSDETGLSIFSGTIIERLGLGYADVCRKPLNAVAAIPGSEPPRHGLRTEPDPWPDDAPEPDHPRNAAHAVINGIADLAKPARNQIARDLAKVAVLVHPQ
jgi:hypothetical protein